MPHVHPYRLGWGAAGSPPTEVQCWIVTCPRARGVSLRSSALIHLDIPFSTALLLIRSGLGGLGGLQDVSVLCWGLGVVVGCPPHHPHHDIQLLAHAHLPHLVTSFDNLLWVFLSPPLQKKSKGGWHPQILPLPGLSSTASSPASPHPPPAPSGPNFPTLSLSCPLLKAELPLLAFLTLGWDPLGASGWRCSAWSAAGTVPPVWLC